MHIDETTEALNQLYGDLLAVNAGRGSDRTREDIAHEGAILLSCTHIMTGTDPHPDHDGPKTAIAETLTQLMHFCDKSGIDFREAMQKANFNFKNNIREEKDYA